MKVKPEYELETMITVREELDIALSEVAAADLRISLLNTYSNDSLKEAYAILWKVMEDINERIKND